VITEDVVGSVSTTIGEVVCSFVDCEVVAEEVVEVVLKTDAELEDDCSELLLETLFGLLRWNSELAKSMSVTWFEIEPEVVKVIVSVSDEASNVVKRGLVVNSTV